MNGQPYQRATEEFQRQSQAPGNAIRSLGSAVLSGVGAAGGSVITGAGFAAGSRILPLLNKLLSPSIAVKALEKVDKRFGKFFRNTTQSGKTLEDGLEFLRRKAGIAEEIGQGTQVFEPTQEMNRQSAMSQFNQKKQPMQDQLEQQFEQGYGKKTPAQDVDIDQAILAAVEKVMTM
jgi:hypothetical protein